MPKMLNADGTVSQYGFACGHIQRSGGLKTRVDLYQEHGTYFVKAVYDGKVVELKGFPSNALSAARDYYKYAREKIDQTLFWNKK